jgi:phosphonate transport system substrate-binding protein
MNARSLFALLSFVFTASTALAQQEPEAILAINEGVTYQDAGTPSERYKPLLEMLAKELKRPVRIKTVSRYSEFDKDLAAGRYELAFIHPAHVGLQAVQRGNYHGIATAKGFTSYRASIMVSKESKLRSIEDLRGKKIGVPSIESITTAMFTAHLQENKFASPEKFYQATRYQDAVPFMIEHGFVEAGVTGSGKVAKSWADKGGRILGETPGVPIKQFLVSDKIDVATRQRIQTLLLTLSDTPTGKHALEKVGIPGFVPWDNKVMNEAAQRLNSIRLGL